jgi:hypothetical protein
MSKAVFKFQIPMQDEFEIKMPVGADLLYVASQRENVASQREIGCLWADG